MTNERLWVSHFSLDDVMGGTEKLGGQFSRAMKLKYMSARKLGINGGTFWEVSEKIDSHLRLFHDIDVLVRNSTIGTTFHEGRPNIGLDIVVCCENYRAEAEAVREVSEEFYWQKMVDHERQIRAVKEADIVVVISNGEALEFIKDGIPKSKIRVIMPYVDLDIFKPDGRRRYKNTPVFVGRRHIRKGWDIVEALTKVPNFTVRNITDGLLTDEAVASEYLHSDFLLMPSRYESFGYIFAEALATNTPVIASRVGLFKTWQPTEYGIFPEHTDIESFIDAMKSFDSSNFEESREMAEETFSRERFKRECDELLLDYGR